MENKLRNAFDKIQAGDSLKEKTADYLKAEARKRNRPRRIYRQRLAAVCAAFAVFLLIGGFSFFTPSAYVDMDVNPSIALTLNRYGFVLKAAPYNDDGAAILQNMDVRCQSWEQAVHLLLDEMIRQGYLAPDGLVSVTVQTGNGNTEQKMLGEIRESVDTLLDSHHSTASADVFAVSREVRDCAHDYNLSPAKYLAITQLQEVDPTASYEQCAEHSISEIKELTEEHCGGHHEENDTDAGNAAKEDSAGEDESHKPDQESMDHHGHEDGEEHH